MLGGHKIPSIFALEQKQFNEGRPFRFQVDGGGDGGEEESSTHRCTKSLTFYS
jgi:hypothetical protein